METEHLMIYVVNQTQIPAMRRIIGTSPVDQEHRTRILGARHGSPFRRGPPAPPQQKVVAFWGPHGGSPPTRIMREIIEELESEAHEEKRETVLGCSNGTPRRGPRLVRVGPTTVVTDKATNSAVLGRGGAFVHPDRIPVALLDHRREALGSTCGTPRSHHCEVLLDDGEQFAGAWGRRHSSEAATPVRPEASGHESGMAFEKERPGPYTGTWVRRGQSLAQESDPWKDELELLQPRRVRRGVSALEKPAGSSGSHCSETGMRRVLSQPSTTPYAVGPSGGFNNTRRGPVYKT